MKIIHFSDPHAGAMPDSLSAYFDKRIVGTMNYLFKRRFLHNMELMQKGVDYILQEKPDVVVCSGDLTSTGQSREFDIILEILMPLICSGIKMFYVPGNHDLYVKNNRCRRAFEEAFAKLNGENVSFSSLPEVFSVEECDFMPVNESRPTNIFLSTGYLTSEVSDKIIEIAEVQRERPLIMIGHFPVREKSSPLDLRHRMYGQKSVLELLNSQKIDLSLCGHTHKWSCDVDGTGRGEVIAGSLTKTADLNVIEYDKESNSFSHYHHVLG